MQQCGSTERQKVQIMASHYKDLPQVTFRMFIHCQQEIGCAEKAHVLENKGLFDDAVTGARIGLVLDTRVLMSDPDKSIICLGTPDKSLSL